MNPITYMSEQPEDYAKALTGCRSADEVRVVTAAYESIAADAKAIADTMDDAAFRRFKRGMNKERKGEFAGEKFALEFGAVLMPEVMLKVGMIAAQFGAPWGCAYIRLKEMGKLPVHKPPSGRESP